MARYDRIARIEPPERDDAYPAWMTLRDLEGREREPELGRRARLRFLALRPVRRMIQRGADQLDEESLQIQLESVRGELDVLPSADPERRRLTNYLDEVGGRSPMALVTATLDVGGAAEVAGHPFAAEEFYETGLEIAREEGLRPQHMLALRQLARVLRKRGRHDRSVSCLEEAAALADASGDLVQWARAFDGLAAVAIDRGEIDEARRFLDEIEARGKQAGNDEVQAIAHGGRCGLELAHGNTEAALEAGWNAVELFQPDIEDRNAVLLNLATGFRRMGLGPAAESCYDIVARRSTLPEHRDEARAEHAVVAAESGNVQEFGRRREAALERPLDDDPRLEALIHMALGRGGLLVGDVDDARTHIRKAISTARNSGDDAILLRSEELLEKLEQGGAQGGAPSREQPTDVSRQVAERIRSLTEELVHSH